MGLLYSPNKCYCSLEDFWLHWCCVCIVYCNAVHCWDGSYAILRVVVHCICKGHSIQNMDAIVDIVHGNRSGHCICWGGRGYCCIQQVTMLPWVRCFWKSNEEKYIAMHPSLIFFAAVAFQQTIIMLTVHMYDRKWWEWLDLDTPSSITASS